MLEGLCLVTIVIVVILALVPAGTLACTSILVIPGASVDGSATVAHTADCGSCGIPQGRIENLRVYSKVTAKPLAVNLATQNVLRKRRIPVKDVV